MKLPMDQRVAGRLEREAKRRFPALSDADREIAVDAAIREAVARKAKNPLAYARRVLETKLVDVVRRKPAARDDERKDLGPDERLELQRAADLRVRKQAELRAYVENEVGPYGWPVLFDVFLEADTDAATRQSTAIAREALKRKQRAIVEEGRRSGAIVGNRWVREMPAGWVDLQFDLVAAKREELRRRVVEVMCSRVFIGDSPWRPTSEDLAILAIRAGDFPDVKEWADLSVKELLQEEAKRMAVEAKRCFARDEGHLLVPLKARRGSSKFVTKRNRAGNP